MTVSFKEDSEKRDFTINALGLTSSGEILDYHGGIEDLYNGIIKAVGNPYDRFKEDIIRIMRAIRFAVKYDFSIDNETSDAIKKCSESINDTSIERIYNEIYKAAELGGEKFGRYIELLDEHLILEKILPEITCMKNYLHGPIHHPEGAVAIRKSDGEIFEYDKKYENNNNFEIKYGTVWDHTIGAIKQSTSTDPELNLAILFHDVGKPISFVKKYDAEKKIYKYTYHGHDVKGLDVFEKISERFKLSTEFTEKVKFCILNHMRMHLLVEMKKSKVAALVNHKWWEFLKYVSWCDDSCRKGAFEVNKKVWEAIEKRVADIKNQIEEQNDVLNYINGTNVMEICKIEPGPSVGKIIRLVKENVIQNNITDIEKIKKLIKSYKNC